MDPRPRERPWPFQGPVSGRRPDEGCGGEPSGGRVEPLSAAPRPQPRRLVPLGRGSFRDGPKRGPSHLPLGRLLDVLLVSRHGARELLRPGRRPGDERGFRQHQGGSRGAPRRRRDLHDRDPADDPCRGLAELVVPDARPRAFLCRHLLPAPRRPGEARVLAGAAVAAPGLAPPASRVDAAGGGPRGSHEGQSCRSPGAGGSSPRSRSRGQLAKRARRPL